MMPTLTTLSSVSARVQQATSEFLVAPDWSMNMDICNYCNSNRWRSKDIVKEIKRRLRHKNSKVQLLTLTLLEMMMKNCGEYIHHQMAERKVLEEMIKLVKKKGDANVKERILSLLDSWQETFGGPGGKHSQYFRACDELRRYGVHFPPRTRHSVAAASSTRLGEAMTSEVESLSSSTLESMRNVLELLDDMLQAVNPNDRMAVKEEVIVDLVERSRTNQKKLMQMITTTTDEGLLAQGIEMNDSLQNVLAMNDAIASGAPLPKLRSFKGQEPFNTRKGKDKSPISNEQPSSSSFPPTKSYGNEDEEDEDEDELGQLARRHSKSSSTPSQSVMMGSNEDDVSSSNSNSNALVLIDAPEPTSKPTTSSNSKEQDLIDLLSIVLTTSSAPDDTPQPPISATEEVLLQEPMNNYIVPWAQPQAQQTLNAPPQFQNQYQQLQPQCQMMAYTQYSSGYPQAPWEASSGYSINQNFVSNPLLSQNGCSTWPVQNFNSFQGSHYGSQPMFGNAAVNPSSMRSLQQSNSLQYPSSVNGNMYANPQVVTNQQFIPTQGGQSLQHVNSYYQTVSINGNNPTMNGNTLMNNGSNGVASGQNKAYTPPYRLLEEINVVGGSTEGKMKSGPYTSASEKSNQNMVPNTRSQLNLLD